jgi:hypothetical protein
VIDNFETFPESINTPSYDQRFRSYDILKWTELLEFCSEWATIAKPDADPIVPDSGKVPYTKVVDNVNIFLASSNTSSSEKQSRSNDLWKLRVLLEISGQITLAGQP